MPMQRHELEEAIEKLILESEVSTEEVVETLEMLLDRYEDQLEEEEKGDGAKDPDNSGEGKED